MQRSRNDDMTVNRIFSSYMSQDTNGDNEIMNLVVQEWLEDRVMATVGLR